MTQGVCLEEMAFTDPHGGLKLHIHTYRHWLRVCQSLDNFLSDLILFYLCGGRRVLLSREGGGGGGFFSSGVECSKQDGGGVFYTAGTRDRGTGTGSQLGGGVYFDRDCSNDSWGQF